MDKEEYRRAFNAGMEYWQWVQTDEPKFHKPINFEEWYDTVILPQAEVIKKNVDSVSACPKCKFEPMITVDEKKYCEMCGYDEEGEDVCEHKWPPTPCMLVKCKKCGELMDINEQENEPKSPCCGAKLVKLTVNWYDECIECGKTYKNIECKCVKFVGGDKWYSNGCKIHPNG